MRQRSYIHIYLPVLAILIMWLSKAVEYFLILDFKKFGIFPRKIEGLKGIIFTPFIHNDFNHLISNTLPFLFLSMAILYFYHKSAFRIIVFLWLMTGMAVWIGGRYAWHIGASGVVYAFASFLFFSGVLSKERRLIAISLLVIFLYGGMIWGVLPGKVNISWESHLYGFISGFILAFYMGRQSRIMNINDEEPEKDFKIYSSTHDDEFDIFYNFNENDN